MAPRYRWGSTILRRLRGICFIETIKFYFKPRSYIIMSDMYMCWSSVVRTIWREASYMYLSMSICGLIPVHCPESGLTKKGVPMLKFWVSEWVIRALSRSWQFCSLIATGTRFHQAQWLGLWTRSCLYVVCMCWTRPSCASPTRGQSL